MDEHSIPGIVVGPRLRPLSNQLADPMRLIYRHWAPLLIAQVIMIFGSIILSVVAALLLMAPVFSGVINGMDADDILRYILSGYLWIAIAIVLIPMTIIGVWAMAAMIAAIGYKGGGMAPIGGSFRAGLKFLLPYLILSLLVSLAYAGGFVMLIFPAVILTIGLSLTWYIVVNENVSVFKAIGTSWHVTKGYKWSIFGRLLLLMLIVWVITVGLAMFGLVPFMGLMTAPVNLIISFILTPYALAYFYCIYDDLRAARRDVYDFRGGISVFMVICWILGAAAWGGLIFLVMHLIQMYMK